MRHEPHLLELAPEHLGRAGIELRFHQVRHQMDDVRLEAPVQKAARGLQSQQAAADDSGASRGRCAGHDALAVVERAKHEHALLERAVLIAHVVERRNHRAAAGRNDELVVALRRSRRLHCTCFACRSIRSTRTPAWSVMPLDGVPRERIDEDVVRLVAAREHAREQDAVVVAARLVAEDRDFEPIAAAAREQIVDEPRPRHAVADDDEPLFIHWSRCARRTL